MAMGLRDPSLGPAMSRSAGKTKSKPRLPNTSKLPPAKPAVPVVAEPNYHNTAPAGTGSGGVGINSVGAAAPYAAPTPPPPPAMTDDQWLAQDAEFNDTQKGLQRDFENLLQSLSRQRSDYELDVNNTYRNMGYDPAAKAWNQKDKLTQYGQAFNNQLGDFASRGMLDSSLYGSALNDLNRGFEQQRGDIDIALQRFLGDQKSQEAQAKAELEARIGEARRQALARMTGGLGL